MRHISGTLRDSTLGENTYETRQRGRELRKFSRTLMGSSVGGGLWINRGGGWGGGV